MIKERSYINKYEILPCCQSQVPSFSNSGRSGTAGQPHTTLNMNSIDLLPICVRKNVTEQNGNKCQQIADIYQEEMRNKRNNQRWESELYFISSKDWQTYYHFMERFRWGVI